MILLQIFTVIFSIALAGANKVPCQKMIGFGASLKEGKEFHRANAVVKIIWALINVVDAHTWIMFPLSLLIQWTVFDIALNAFLKKDNWLYVGETSTIDKALRLGITIHIWKWKILIPGLGEEAGLWKLLIVSTVILVINFFL